ncbi:MAG: hypothetical protein OIF57_16975 [Marinobacterium sp.]|nr:hypothetical protein [Marinobacterium sp.]
MMNLYTWNTAQGHSVAIMLEALRLHCSVHPVDTLDPSQNPITFQEISPTYAPALVDHEGP